MWSASTVGLPVSAGLLGSGAGCGTAACERQVRRDDTAFCSFPKAVRGPQGETNRERREEGVGVGVGVTKVSVLLSRQEAGVVVAVVASVLPMIVVSPGSLPPGRR